MQQDIVYAVVVTYNRKILLQECLDALLNQTRDVQKIILIDNASTDGTEEMLREQGYLALDMMDYIKMDKNTGGSGGFYEGIRRTRNEVCDWVWVMDDDTIPATSCLEELLHANDVVMSSEPIEGMESVKSPAFYASAVYGPEGEFMNLPELSNKKSPNGYAYWYQFLGDSIVGISSATFVSVLISKRAIDQCGLPCRDYFIWGDDSEYTMRLTRFYGDGFLVGRSIAIHKRMGAKLLSMDHETNENRVELYHYLYRNQEINARYYGGVKRKFYWYVKRSLNSLSYLKQPFGVKKYKAIMQGYWESVVQYKRFKEYIDGQLGLNEPH